MGLQKGGKGSKRETERERERERESKLFSMKLTNRNKEDGLNINV
jgi:hypothetical protein